MSWNDFVGKAYTREEFLKEVSKLTWPKWKPSGIVIHNTAAPTLAQWAEKGANHEARIRNLKNYYQNEQKWHGGPHLFISRDYINIFDGLEEAGTHSPSFNKTHIGIEMVGNYDVEAFNSGEGAKVRDNTIFAAAALCKRLGLNPDTDIKFHKEDPKTTHNCPGKYVLKPALISAIKLAIAGNTVTEEKTDGGPVIKTPYRFTNITATVFSGPDDHIDNNSTGSYGILDHKKPGVALPFVFKGNNWTGPRPKVRVYYAGKSVICDVMDVGPWEINDPYWLNNGRPKVENLFKNKQKDHKGRIPTNDAGIDLTPAAAAAIGLRGKGKVDWEFVENSPITTIATPIKEPAKEAVKAGVGAAAVGGTIYGLQWFLDHPILSIIIVAGLAAIGFFAWRWWKNRQKSFVPIPIEVAFDLPNDIPLVTSLPLTVTKRKVKRKIKK